MISELRPYQVQTLSDIRDSVRGGVRRLVVQAATGAGKTKLAAAIVEGGLAKGSRVAFCVPSISLIDQTVESFYAEGIRDIGVIQANHGMTDWSKPVQVCSIQTIQKRGFPEAQVVIFDEIHRLHEAHRVWLKHPDWQAVPMIGLSATPWTKGLGKYFESLLIAATTSDLIDQGFLSKFRVFATGHPDLSEVRTVAGDYHEGELSGAMQKGELTADIVRTWSEKWGKDKTLCFGVDKAHAKSIQERFEFAGITCGYQDADTTADERREIKRKFHNGTYRVVSNIQTLTTGVDWDVRCLILARPTRSEMLYVQIIGRALRTAPGKDCLVRDTMILTNRGEIRIQDITLDHKVWDGVNFVAHAGAICKGMKSVISHDGITATPEHKVMTDEGWKALSDAHCRRLRITRSGFGRNPIRLVENNISQDGGKKLQSFGRGGMFALSRTTHEPFSQYSEAPRYSGLPTLQWSLANCSTALALSALPSATRSMLQSILSGIQKLWSARYRISFRQSKCSFSLGNGKSWHPRGSEASTGSREQRWSLRSWKFAMGTSHHKCEQHQVFGRKREVHCFSQKLSGSEVRGQDIGSPCGNVERSRNCGEMGKGFKQTEREVWDIYGAGPLQRFTANGRLVHNCALILDHSDTTAKLGFVTEIHHDSLNNGKPVEKSVMEKKEPLPKECKNCAFLKPPKTKICPNCGHETVIRSEIMECDGELVEFKPGAGKAKAKLRHDFSEEEKRQFYAELKTYAIQHEYKPGWASMKYKEKFKGWPPANYKWIEPAKILSPTVSLWIRSRNIAWHKSKQNHSVASDAQ